jgi:hypothetical protein
VKIIKDYFKKNNYEYYQLLLGELSPENIVYGKDLDDMDLYEKIVPSSKLKQDGSLKLKLKRKEYT